MRDREKDFENLIAPTPCESEILHPLGEGRSVREIAAECGRSCNTTGDCFGGMRAKLARTRVLPEKWEPIFR